MDPITQGAIGAALPQSLYGRGNTAIRAGGLGFLAGMAADLDILIRSDTDPLLFLEYHRQFTHALVFIPVGGLICALAYCALFRKWDRGTLLMAWIYCALGYGTHGLLDALTSYGTMLLWPFSDERFAFSIISVVDPLFTIPVVALVVLAARRRRRRFAALALAWGALYLGAGYIQNERATAIGHAVAASRGHVPIRLEVKPSFANLLVWKIIYETADRYYVDAVRVAVSPRVFEGKSILKLDMARDFPDMDPQSQQVRDIARFTKFSDGFVARDPVWQHRIIDVRYSMVPNEIEALWSIAIFQNATATDHVAFQTHRDNPRESFRRLWNMIVDPPSPDP